MSQLMLRGYDASFTFGRTKNVDILVSEPGGQLFRLECKTSRKADRKEALFGQTLAWIMSAKHEEIVDPKLFYCFVSMADDIRQSRFFIVPSKAVAAYVRAEHRYYLNKHPSGRKNDMRSFRIGLPNQRYLFETPPALAYEDKWPQLGAVE